MMEMCCVKLERRLVFDSDRHDTYPKVKPAIREYVEKLCHTSDPKELRRRVEGCLGDAQAVGCARGKAKGKGRDGKVA